MVILRAGQKHWFNLYTVIVTVTTLSTPTVPHITAKEWQTTKFAVCGHAIFENTADHHNGNWHGPLMLNFGHWWIVELTCKLKRLSEMQLSNMTGREQSTELVIKNDREHIIESDENCAVRILFNHVNPRWIHQLRMHNKTPIHDISKY